MNNFQTHQHLAGEFESYSLNQIAVICKKRSKLLAKFLFKMSAFHFYTCMWQHRVTGSMKVRQWTHLNPR